MRVDALIVGQGLAGAILAWVLLKRGLSVLAVDDGRVSASRVAAGLLNPVTGQRLVKSAGAEVLLSARRCYLELSRALGRRYYYPAPMLRVLRNAAEAEAARRRLARPEYRAYLSGWTPRYPGLTAPFGVLRQEETGFLLTAPLLDDLAAYFQRRQVYRRADFEHAELRAEGRGLRWRDVYCRFAVFCEGYRAMENPWFARLPFQLAKGEILSGATDARLAWRILNYGHWCIPQPDGGFKTGATFTPFSGDLSPDPNAESLLRADLLGVCPGLAPLRMFARHVGVRAASLDKQAFAGAHPSHDSILIFNGFGARGGLSIPWCAEKLANWMIYSQPLPAAIDVRRYELG